MVNEIDRNPNHIEYVVHVSSQHLCLVPRWDVKEPFDLLFNTSHYLSFGMDR